MNTTASKNDSMLLTYRKYVPKDHVDCLVQGVIAHDMTCMKLLVQYTHVQCMLFNPSFVGHWIHLARS